MGTFPRVLQDMDRRGVGDGANVAAHAGDLRLEAHITSEATFFHGARFSAEFGITLRARPISTKPAGANRAAPTAVHSLGVEVCVTGAVAIAISEVVDATDQ